MQNNFVAAVGATYPSIRGRSYGATKIINDSETIDRSLLRSYGFLFRHRYYIQVAPTELQLNRYYCCYRQVAPTELLMAIQMYENNISGYIAALALLVTYWAAALSLRIIKL